MHGIDQLFHTELERLSAADSDEIGLRPSHLCAAANAVLACDGASLSMAEDDMRTPLGASDEVAAHAERLQFTAGDGPCLQALADSVARFAPTAELQQRWPGVAALWGEHTPYCSAMSVPIRLNTRGRAAMNLYFRNERGGEDLEVAHVRSVAHQISGDLVTRLSDPDQIPALIGGPSATARGRVWIAVGMVAWAFGLGFGDSLDRLRSHAFSTDTTVDELAADLVSGITAVGDLYR